MEEITLSWTKDEFLAYLLIYAAQINQIETEEEKEFIESRFDSKILKKVYKEIDSDNDYQRIQKVMVYTYQENYLSQDLDHLLKEIKELLLCDGRFDVTEQALYYYLKKIFNISSDEILQDYEDRILDLSFQIDDEYRNLTICNGGKTTNNIY